VRELSTLPDPADPRLHAFAAWRDAVAAGDAPAAQLGRALALVQLGRGDAAAPLLRPLVEADDRSAAAAHALLGVLGHGDRTAHLLRAAAGADLRAVEDLARGRRDLVPVFLAAATAAAPPLDALPLLRLAAVADADADLARPPWSAFAAGGEQARFCAEVRLDLD
jgi:hypothetical protein